MFAIVILGLAVGMFALLALGTAAVLDVALQAPPPDDAPELVSYASGREIRTRRAEAPKSQVA
jgi:hypothetical protein